MNGAGEQPHFTDAVGKTVPRPFVPPQVASPINLLNPDRYEFYTFNDSGELVKRLMTLKEIQSIVANGNGAAISDSEPESQSVLLNSIPLSSQGSETKVQDIVDNVQNVLSREMENNKNASQIPTQLLDTPDVSSSWSMILPAIFGNTGDEIMPHKPINMTPETEIEDTTTTRKVQPTKRVTTEAQLNLEFTTPATPKLLPTTSTKSRTKPTKISTRGSTTQQQTSTTSEEQASTTAQQKIKPTSQKQTTTSQLQTTSVLPLTKKQTEKARPKPTRTTTLNIYETTFETTPETVRSTIRPQTTLKVTPTKRIVKKPTSSYKRPLTNSPIIIEKIPKRPHVVESTTDRIETESTKVFVTQKPSTTVEMKNEQATTRRTTTEVPSTTQMTTATSTKKPFIEQTTSSSEEDRQDFAINQIIGSLQSDLFQTFATTNPPSVETTEKDSPMEKIGELNLIPDKVLFHNQLFIDEEDPIVKNLPTTTEAVQISTDTPIFERLEATTTKTKTYSTSLENSEVMQTIEKLIKEQTNGKEKIKHDKIDVLEFDDDDETEIKLKDTLESKSNLTQSEFVSKVATVASSISTKYSSTTPNTIDSTTATPAPTEESDTTVPTILSEALSNVIQLMMKEQESKKTTQKPAATEPSEFDLNKLLHHYQNLNSKQNQQDQLEALSLINEKTTEKFATTEKADEASTIPTVSYETTVVKETSSVSIKKGDDEETATKKVPASNEISTEAFNPTTEHPKIITTTDANNEEFSTFFFVDKDPSEATLDPLNDGLGEFTTEQFVGTEKQVAERKDDRYTTTPTLVESEEESSELVSDVLNAIGIMSDEEDESTTEKLKGVEESQESDEVENAISSLTSTIDKTLATDVKTDFTLTSKIASSLISVADSISQTLDGDDESEEVTTLTPTTVSTIVKQAATTEENLTTEKSTEKVETTENSTEVTEKSFETTEANNRNSEVPELTEKSSESTEKSSEAFESTEAFSTEALIESFTKSDSSDSSTEDSTAEQLMERENDATLEPETLGEKSKDSPMVQLSVIRKDNSLEEIDFITPPTPTSTTIPATEGNFVKIENIATTLAAKLSGFKNKGQEANESVKPIYISMRSTTTPKTSSISNIESSETTTNSAERVPLIEITKPTETPSSSEEDLVEVKIQTKPTVEIYSTTESHQTTMLQFQSNALNIKNNIKSAQAPPRLQSPPIDLSAAPEEALGLTASTAHLSSDLSGFSKLCNDLAFSFWKSITADGISQSRSVIISPYALTSTLSMMFLGARGQTSGEMNDVLRLDDMVSFNPHVVFRNISESIEQSRKSGIAAAAFVRELYSDRSKGKLLPYFKEKAQQFYGAHVEEVNFNVINDILRRRTNLLVKRHTFGKINEYLKTNNIWVNEPLAAISANVFLVISFK